MPSAANAKSEKPASSEATDNSPVRQITTIIEHKIRNLEKRKSKLTSYRDLQKAGKELNADQKVAVAKYDEVAQTLEFARDLSKQVMTVAVSAEREAKKQAKKDAWVRYAAETNKIREVLLILDCLMQMGTPEVRDDFLNGSNGAAKITEEDLKILDDLYPEVTPKHEFTEDGQPGFHIQMLKAAEHLYSIIDGKPKEVLGTTYTHIKEIVSAIHGCGYFDRSPETAVPEVEEVSAPVAEEEQQEAAPAPEEEEIESELQYAPLPVPPAAAVVPAPGYPLCALPPITLQEVEHAYFAHQYPQQRPITEVIGSQNFYFLQESEIDSPIGTPQPPPIDHLPPQAGPIPTQTFTNQHFVRAPEPGAPMPPQPHFPPHPEMGVYPPPGVPMPVHLVAPAQPPAPEPEERREETPPADAADDDWKEGGSPARSDGERQGQRYRRGRGRGAPNGLRGRGGYRQPSDGYRQHNDGYRQPNDGYRRHDNYQYHGKYDYQPRHKDDYQPRHKDDYQPRHKDDYQPRHKDDYQPRHKDDYQPRHKDDYQPRHKDGYYGNGDAGEHGAENGREAAGGYRGRGRGARGGRPPRRPQYARRDNE